MPSVTKILFRRGLDSQRQTTILNQGEPGYSTDTKRLFVGDGATAGGTAAGIYNYGTVAALSGNYIYNSVQTNITPTAFNLLSSAEIGDIVYDQASTSIWSISSTSVVAGTTVPLLSDFVHLYSTTGFESSQLYYNGSKLTIKNSGVGINQLNTSITAGSQTLSGGSGGVIDIKPKSINNTFLSPAANNSVKITNNIGSVTDVTVGPNQILGQTNATGSALGAINLTTTGSISLSSNKDTLQFFVPPGIPQGGGFITGALSALNIYNGKFVTDVAPTGSNDVVNLSFARTLSSGLITPAYLSSNYYPLTGGTLSGALVGSSYIQATNGFYSTNNYTGSYSDGIVVDYVTGNGRVSVGTNDAITFYNGGPASAALLTLSGNKVGIGTTTPGSPLSFGTSVVGAPGQANVIRLWESGGSNFGFGISNNTLNIVSPATTLFTNNNLSAMYINASGNVGINTSNPQYTLDVRGDINIGDPSQGLVGTSGNKLWFGGSNNTDSLYTYRYNNASNVTEWRFNVGDDSGPGSNNYGDSFVIGNFPAATPTVWTDWMRVISNDVTFAGTVHATNVYASNGPTVNNELTRKDYVDTKFNNAVTPAGTVMFFAGTTAPAGWIKANGAVLPQASYPALFAALPKQGNGNTIWWVANDGAANFRLPDLRGQFIRGWNDGIAASNAGSNTLTIPTTDAGRSFGTIQGDAFGSHTHSINDPGHRHNFVFTQGNDTIMNNNYAGTGINGVTYYGAPHELEQSGNPERVRLGYYSSQTSLAGTGITINNNGNNETRPTNIALLACIKY